MNYKKCSVELKIFVLSSHRHFLYEGYNDLAIIPTEIGLMTALETLILSEF